MTQNPVRVNWRRLIRQPRALEAWRLGGLEVRSPSLQAFPYNPIMAAAVVIILTSISMLALGWLVWMQVQKQESQDDTSPKRSPTDSGK